MSLPKKVVVNKMESLKENKKVNMLISEFSRDKDIIQAVKKIESGISTTQFNYGAYMQFLSPYNKDNLTLYIISESLKLVKGVNIQGVNWALKLLKGV